MSPESEHRSAPPAHLRLVASRKLDENTPGALTTVVVAPSRPAFLNRDVNFVRLHGVRAHYRTPYRRYRYVFRCR